MRNLTYYFLVLDIETSKETKTIIEDGKEKQIPFAVWLSYGFCKLYDIQGKTINKCYFREWFDLIAYLNKTVALFPYYKIICYVHNLSYEFDFLLKNISPPIKMLSNSTHDVISTTLELFPQIDFRCTYQLTGNSLEKIGEQLGFEKLHSTYRTIYPNDTITEEEILYCERDCDVVAKYICDVSLKEYGKITNIPLTKTGRVRKTFKEFYSLYERNPEWDLMPNEDCYEALLDAFQGGICISNPMFTGLILNNVHSYDIKSSYPYSLLNYEYPYTIEKKQNFTKENLKEKFWIAKICFYGISSKFEWGWLSNSKLENFDEKTEFFNGKVIQSEWIIRTITNIDFENINLTYVYDDLEILEFYSCEKYSYLPIPYIETIKTYSVAKDNLKEKLKKDPENLEIQREYMLAKNDFNSIYGMCVQKLMNPEFYIDEFFVWHEKEIPYVQDKTKHMKRNFLYGIFCTAYSRRNFLRGIVYNCPHTFVYGDTDSIKFIGVNKFKDTNPRLKGEFAEIKSLKELGTFEYEQTYEQFITYGAKKYCYTDKGIVHLTVAGLPKTVKPLKSIYDFKCGKVFHNCKLGKKYINTNYYVVINDDTYNRDIVDIVIDEEIQKFFDENSIQSNGGVALYPTSYELDITSNDKFIIKNRQRGLELWLKRHKQHNGIDLTDCFHTMQAFME